ncbi:Unknown protein [Striga hermonthica]|uniref:DUF4218 domain-containing protein n=1 Tax=Striga hermonthica TaxID=68872 RepID=A0A9N7NFF3_STRHE|nr:Unknown protein [Striga hermonthica]
MLEKIFPPSFFDIMMHLPIHLVDEVKLSGPVSGWWMFGPERYLGKLKEYVKNRSRPEGSIAEGYLAEEGLIFCSRYLPDGAKKKSKGFNRKSVEVDACDDVSIIFPKVGHPLGRKKRGKKGAFSLDSNTQNLAHRTKDNNPRVDGVNYYGRINDIIEIDYWGSFSVVLFNCEWFQEENDSYGLTRVNFNKLCYEDDPFVLASQVNQVFYVKDAIEDGCYYAMKKLAKDFTNMKDQTEDTYFIESSEYVEDTSVSMLNGNDENSWSREGAPPVILDDLHAIQNQEPNSESDDTGLI